MTGAIEFLKHAKEMCDNTDCKYCVYCCKTEQCVILWNLSYLSDNEIADLVREVERWWRENDDKKVDK